MKGTAVKLYRYLEGSDKKFVIPVYQRNYDWKIENCKQLFDDLVSTARNNKNAHFFGSVVSVYNTNGKGREFLIIDGQQRITTVSLILLALYNLLDKGIVTSQSSILKQKIYEECLVDKFQPEEKRIKLKPVKDDQKAFNSLFGDEDEYVKTSGVIANYNYFVSRILKHEISIDELYDAVCKLEIIDIELTPPDDDPQLIFASLNSTGLALEEGDKIRNFILMGLKPDEQEKYYNQYWNKIEELVNYDVSPYIRHYLTMKQGKTPVIKKVYFTFKDFVEKEKLETEDMLCDLLKNAKNYSKLIYANTDNAILNQSIKRLFLLETSVSYPFFLDVFNLYDDKKMSINEVIEIFNIIESYIFRRTICDLPSNSLNKVFEGLSREISKLWDGNSYVDVMKYVLLSKKGKPRFPDNMHFEAALRAKEVYTIPSKNKWYLFEKLENQNSLERVNVYEMIENGSCSIEHIMPQTLSKKWMDDLGESHEQIHLEWLHRLANTTLTAYNSKYSNSRFIEKRDMTDGYKESGFRINKELVNFDKWTTEEMQTRENSLVTSALSLWNYISTDFMPKTRIADTYSLDDDIDFTGYKISEFMFMEQVYKVTSWSEFFQKIIIALHDTDETILNKIISNEAYSEFKSIVSDKEDDFNASVQIDDNIFANTHSNTQSKIINLIKLFGLFKQEPSELIFSIEKTENLADEGSSPRFEIRLRFWELLLSDFNKKSELYKDVNPSKDNWLTAGAGIASGLQYCFTIGRRNCSVSFEINTNNKDKNKLLFDKMHEQKDAIESAFGSSLIWERKDDNKISRIKVIDTDSNVFKEETWADIVSFMSNNMARLYDATIDIAKEVALKNI